MSNKVTYGEIIEALSRKTDFSKQKSEAFAKALISRVKQELEETGKASITNFGSFKVKEVAERQGQNPQTGEPITIPAHKRVSFTPYKALKEDVNANFAHLETELLGEKPEEKDEESDEPKTSSEEKKEQEPEEKVKETIFQFDDEPEDDSEPEDDELEEEKAKETSEQEPVEEDTRDEDPFAFDVQEPEEEPEEAELDPEPEPEPELESPADKPFIREGKKEGNNLALIMILAALLAVALVSVWWFFLRTEPTNMPAQQAKVEQPRVQQIPNNQSSESAESNETAQETNESEKLHNPVQSETQTAASSGTVKEKSSAPTGKTSTSTYMVKKDEWYWVIGKKVYGKSQFWPLIYQANFTMDTHPDSLEDNTSLQVPALEGTAANPSKADYRRLAEASQMVSDAYKKFGLNEKAGEYARFAKKWQGLGS
ncbi:HU family DNA-binding protein [Gracilimonas sediminicola]|uniref:HU family DNA-binding protein n=1 Tax=Gracilimonas sediminicola TaxID=2952158 RepID=A0A9X2RD24_9BACT|nr:HU family DNA-binding protein [Gracilimonas sediminicola]MCP9291116.1 HU family DNA-binding protein [Gracilimonas sediminicola]